MSFPEKKDNLKQESYISSSPKDWLQYTSYPRAHVRFLYPQSQMCQVYWYIHFYMLNKLFYLWFLLPYLNIYKFKQSPKKVLCIFLKSIIVLLVWGTPWCWTWNWVCNLPRSQLSIFNYQRGTECLSRISIINIHSVASIALL